MSKEITELLKEATKDLLTPESLNAIQEAINVKVDEKAKLQVEAALVAQDDKHCEMLKKLMEQMDTDYTTKMEKLVKRLDESYAAKLTKVKGFYDTKITQLNEQLETAAVKYVGDLSTKIDTFVESRLNEILPTDRLNEAVENVKAVRVLEQIRALVGINEDSVDANVKAAMVDGKRQIDESKQQIDQIVNENAQLKQRLAQKEVDLLLEQKTAKLPAKKREHVKRVLAGKDASFINENLNYVCEMFDREETIESEKAKKTADKVGDKVDQPVIISESTAKVDSNTPLMNDYLSNLK